MTDNLVKALFLFAVLVVLLFHSLLGNAEPARAMSVRQVQGNEKLQP